MDGLHISDHDFQKFILKLLNEYHKPRNYIFNLALKNIYLLEKKIVLAIPLGGYIIFH